MRFNKRDIIYASLVFGWISIFWNVYDQLIQSINAYAFALDAKASGYILAIDNILGLVVLPLFGHFSDACKCKYGKRTPFIVIGSAISLIGIILVGFFAAKRILVGYVVSLCFTLFAMAAYRSAGLSLVPDFVYEPQRGRANSIANLVSVAFTILGIVIALIFMPLKAAQSANFMPVTLTVAGSSLIVFAVYVVKFNERKTINNYQAELELYKQNFPEKYREETCPVEELSAEEMKVNVSNKVLILFSLFFFYIAYNALVSNFTVYSDVALGFKVPQIPLIVVILGALPGFLFAGKLTDKLGRKYTIALGLLQMMVCLMLSSVCTGNSVGERIPLFIFYFLAGIGYGFAMVNLYPFYLELSKTKNIGQNTGIFASVMTAAMVITPILAGELIEAIGKMNGSTYNIKQVIDGVQTIVTKTGDYTILLPYCAIALAISTLFIFFIRTKPKASKSVEKSEDTAK